MAESVDYDAAAAAYDRRYERNLYSGVEDTLRAWTRGRVLEVGCGTGHWIALLEETGVRVVGLDRSRGMLAHATRACVGCLLAQGTAEALPYDSAVFDGVYCVNAVHHFPDKPGFLREARRVLRAGGEILIIGLDPHTGLDRWALYDYFDGVLEADRARYPSMAQTQAWAQEAGFESARTSLIQHVPMTLPARDVLAAGLLDKAVTSQLAILSDHAYEQGLSRIREAMAQAEADGGVLILESDLRIYAVRGRAGR